MERTRVSQAADLAVLLPYMLGFHPRDSVVVAALEGKRVGLLQRHDLIPEHDNPRPFAADLIERALAHRADAIVVVGYEEAKGACNALRRAVAARARARRLPVVESIVVRDGRWYAPECRDGCCPREGEDLPPADRVPAVASFVLRGCVPLADREAVSGQVRPGTGLLVAPGRIAAEASRFLAQIDAAGGVGGLTVDGPAWNVFTGRSIARAWQAILDPGADALAVDELDDDVLAGAVGSLVDRQWRDALMGSLAPETMPMDRFAPRYLRDARVATRACSWSVAARSSPLGMLLTPFSREEVDAGEVALVGERLAAVVRRVAPADAVHLLVVLAHFWWWVGDGPRAVSCLEEALSVDPAHRLAAMMYHLVSNGVSMQEIA
ncbi:DUF4192 domain-containing protein [Janibacter sp. GXQ6167]|uniref:DUF4192 domain-containing protein n=1 Tax=Janibacter sp. GXQ6167 TaxID=3240791 RepID=UPI003523B2BE